MFGGIRLLALHQAVWHWPLRRTELPFFVSSSLVAALTAQPAGIRFAGEIDINNSYAFTQSLQRALHDRCCVHVDLGSVSFRDPEGIRVLVKSGRRLSSGHKILLHGLPAALVTVLRATGWIPIPGLAICNCGQPVQASQFRQ